MSRKKKRKRNRGGNGGSAAAVQGSPQAAAAPLEELLDIANDQPNPRAALDLFQLA